MDYQKILSKKELYTKNLHTINPISLEKLKMAFDIEFTHNSTAIEGNTLTLIETKLILEDKISVGGKSLREIYEIVNNHKATKYVEECVSQALPLSEEITKNIHSIISENILVGGVYRNEPVVITGATHTPPVGQIMYSQIKFFYDDMQSKARLLNEVEYVAWTHAEFVRIHPFIDGNGRTSRQIMNYQLLSLGYPPISISVASRFEYYDCLDKYCSTGELTLFADMIATLVEERLDEFDSYLKKE